MSIISPTQEQPNAKHVVIIGGGFAGASLEWLWDYVGKVQGDFLLDRPG